jgi:hypothetical protein
LRPWRERAGNRAAAAAAHEAFDYADAGGLFHPAGANFLSRL